MIASPKTGLTRDRQDNDVRLAWHDAEAGRAFFYFPEYGMAAKV